MQGKFDYDNLRKSLLPQSIIVQISHFVLRYKLI